MRVFVEEDAPVPVMIFCEKQRPVTDELGTEFYQCPSCDFARIPRRRETEYAKKIYADEEVTAKCCPGCGRRIDWID